jgi:hypothetical protein
MAEMPVPFDWVTNVDDTVLYMHCSILEILVSTFSKFQVLNSAYTEQSLESVMEESSTMWLGMNIHDHPGYFPLLFSKYASQYLKFLM